MDNKMKVRIVKKSDGNMWHIIRTYTTKDHKEIGRIEKNPYTDTYLIILADYKNNDYIKFEKNSFSEAIKLIKNNKVI